MHKCDTQLNQRIHLKHERGILRTLTNRRALIDFSSNDYLGFARSLEFNERVKTEWSKKQGLGFGATGSRLLTGQHDYIEEIEHDLAQFYQVPATLIFNSGYQANLALLSSVAQECDTILYDEHIHASMREGAKLSGASCFPFRHNDLNHLEQRLKRSSNTCFVCVESIYSMDGSRADLKHLATLCESYGAHLIVDEAHSSGLYGLKGEGLVVAEALSESIFARVHTFGKALGTHGAVIAGSVALIKWLITSAKTFIYATALPLPSLASIKVAHELLPLAKQQRLDLFTLIDTFQNHAPHNVLFSDTAIQALVIPGNTKVKQLATEMQENGFDVRPIVSPTVQKNKERLRICLHSFNTIPEIISFFEILQQRSKELLCIA